MKVNVSPRKLNVGDVELHAHAVGACFGMHLPRCCALRAPGPHGSAVRARMASSRDVLPERNGPISAMQRVLRPKIAQRRH